MKYIIHLEHGGNVSKKVGVAMFVILTYDISETEVCKNKINRVRKFLKKYLIWTQNSVFEGDITEGKLKECLLYISKVIDEETDSVYIYRMNKYYSKQEIGKTKYIDDTIV
jgi:CRISPR-associated protein Cas2